MTKEEEFFIDEDNDGHWYVIPLRKKWEWAEWCDLDSDDEDSWETPNFANPIGGHPGVIIFTKWRTLL